jgi:hypothetical protein
VPQNCLTFDQKIHLLIGIARHFGAHSGTRGYDPEFDVNHDNVIDFADFVQVLHTPTCRNHHHGDND